MCFQYPLEAVKQNNRQKIAKLAQKSAKYMKNLRISRKLIWISRDLQPTAKSILKLKQNHIKIKTKPRNQKNEKKKTALKCRTWTKNLARLEFFFTPQFLAL